MAAQTEEQIRKALAEAQAKLKKAAKKARAVVRAGNRPSMASIAATNERFSPFRMVNGCGGGRVPKGEASHAR
jgi:hypothetical protein